MANPELNQSNNESINLPSRTNLTDLASLFLRIGSTAIGGPAVHIAMMEREVVRRKEWLSHDDFMDIFGACNLIPGPSSTEMAIHIGYRRAGWAGLLVTGTSLTLMAVVTSRLAVDAFKI